MHHFLRNLWLPATVLGAAEMPKVTRQQARFILELGRCRTAKDAAIAAGYSVQSAKQQACDLLRKRHLRVFKEALGSMRLGGNGAPDRTGGCLGAAAMS